MTHNNILTELAERNKKLIQENEILGKTILEIMLKNSSRVRKSFDKTHEQIDELLKQPDWKEKSEFKIKGGKII